ncbi:MAG: MlaD family protein [Enterobacterales bacterium]|nr:MlaD family protein [Enterobacterales bacterium]
MSNNESQVDKSDEILAAKVSPTRSISLVWLIPLVSLFVGLWMVLNTWANQGPEITVFFETAEGLEVGTTKIKYREITIGQVTEIKLNNKFNGVKVTARLDKNTEKLLRTDTDFWVVKPRIGNGGISGLSTLFSGSYIELSPGFSEQKRTDFVGLELPPVTSPGTPGLRITLDSNNQTALKVGDPILFYGIQVGRIEYVHFNVEQRKVYYDAFIQSPYDKLVTTNTRFWKIDGVEFDLNADGLRIQTGTLETFIRGGVTFDVPENLPKGKVITERTFFYNLPE